jgi:hypothetical protein
MLKIGITDGNVVSTIVINLCKLPFSLHHSCHVAKPIFETNSFDS